MRFVYNVLFTIFFCVSLPYYVFRLVRRGSWQKGFWQRFGCYGTALQQHLDGKAVIWFHAVSVGEVNLCSLLVQSFGERLKDWTVVVSTTTTTGMGELERKLPDSVVKIYYPVDFAPSVNRALRVINPRLVVLVEAEIWPNLLWRLADRSIPTFLVNARLSDRSAKRYGQFGFLFRRIFSSLAGVGVQNEADSRSVVSVGCDPKRTVVTGNLKFDAIDLGTRHSLNPSELIEWAGARSGAPVLLGSSTHAGEERLLGEVYLRLREVVPDLFLVIVPRHFERGSEVVKDLSTLGIQTSLRTDHDIKKERSQDCPQERGECLVVDSTGELRFFYEVASVVFVGKSLLAHGGQNPIEAAAAGCAVVVGPNMENFRAVTKTFLSAEGMVQVKDKATLEIELQKLLRDPGERSKLGSQARAVVDRNRRAVDRTVEMIGPFLESAAP